MVARIEPGSARAIDRLPFSPADIRGKPFWFTLDGPDTGELGMDMDSQYREQPKWRQLCKLLPCEDPIKDRNMKTITLLCAVLLFWSTTATYVQNSSAVVSAASAIGWTAENAAKLKAVFHDTNTVAAFYNQTLAPEDQDAADPQAIGEYLIVALNNDGQLELLCTADVTGRAFYTGLTAFSQQKGKIVRFDVSTNGANFVHLGSSLADWGHDGRREILIPDLLGPYNGGDPAVILPDIYRFENGKLVKANEEFSSYYTKFLLPHLKGKLSNATDDKEIAVTKEEISIIQSNYSESGLSQH